VNPFDILATMPLMGFIIYGMALVMMLGSIIHTLFSLVYITVKYKNPRDRRFEINKRFGL